MVLLPITLLSTTSRTVVWVAAVLQATRCYLDNFRFHINSSENLLAKASLPLKKVLSSLCWILPFPARAPRLTF